MERRRPESQLASSKSIARGELTDDERAALHRVDPPPNSQRQVSAEPVLGQVPWKTAPPSIARPYTHVYIYLHIYIHICIYTYMYTYIHA